MARLPQPGGDNGNWGDILNEYLLESLNINGFLKDNSVTANTIAPNSITNAAIASDAVAAANIINGSISEALLDAVVVAKLNADGDVPDWNVITGKPEVIAAGATQAAAKAALGLAKTDVGLSTVDNTSDTAKPISTAVQTALGDKADLIGGFIPSAQMPALALSGVVVVANESDMLELTSTQVQPGDVAVRTDGAGTFILTANDPSDIVHWTRLNAPTDLVTSVNGYVGTVVLGKSDVGLENIDNTSDLSKPISTATQTAFAAKADLVGGVIPSSQMPALALTTVNTAASQAAMIALTTSQAQPGDIAVRTDGAGTFILTNNDPSVLSNWTLLSSPTNTVTSVNGHVGSVSLTKNDLSLGNVDNTSDATKNSAVAALTNKVIDGGSNTFQNIPQSAIANLSAKISRSVVVTSAAFTAGSIAGTDYVYLVSGAHAVTLPTATGNMNRYTFKNTHTANITVTSSVSETIEGAASLTITFGSSVDIISNGTNAWSVI